MLKCQKKRQNPDSKPVLPVIGHMACGKLTTPQAVDFHIRQRAGE